MTQRVFVFKGCVLDRCCVFVRFRDVANAAFCVRVTRRKPRRGEDEDPLDNRRAFKVRR